MVLRTAVTIGGRLGTGTPEQWSCTLWCSASDVLTPQEANSAAEVVSDGLVDRWPDNFADLRTLLSNNAWLDEVRVTSYPAVGDAGAVGSGARRL